MNSSPKTRNSSGTLNRNSVNSRGISNGVLDAGAMGKNGAIPVPGSLNLVNFSICGPVVHVTTHLKPYKGIGDGISFSPNRNLIAIRSAGHGGEINIKNRKQGVVLGLSWSQARQSELLCQMSKEVSLVAEDCFGEAVVEEC